MHIPEHIKAMNRAKVALLMNKEATFFTSVYFSLNQVWDEECPTAWTDGKEIGFNPDFFLGLNQDERVLLMLHEALHVAYIHMERLGSRDMKLWNIAADHAINISLLNLGLKMPEGGHADYRFEGMAAEKIYAILKEEEQKQPGRHSGSGVMEDLKESKETKEDLTRQVEDILVRASIRAQQAGADPGSIPGDIQIILDRLLKPKLPWQKLLLKYFRAYAKSDYSWQKPNRRFLPDFYLPSMHSTSLMDMAVAVDVSGSVTDAEFNRIMSETGGLLRMLKPAKMTLLQFDTAVRNVTPIKDFKKLASVEFKGRGGTRINPVMQWAEENKPKLLLVFSDGEFRQATIDPSRHTDVIWLVYDNPKFTAPFGKVVHYESNK